MATQGHERESEQAHPSSYWVTRLWYMGFRWERNTKPHVTFFTRDAPKQILVSIAMHIIDMLPVTIKQPSLSLSQSLSHNCQHHNWLSDCSLKSTMKRAIYRAVETLALESKLKHNNIPVHKSRKGDCFAHCAFLHNGPGLLRHGTFAVLSHVPMVRCH